MKLSKIIAAAITPLLFIGCSCNSNNKKDACQEAEKPNLEPVMERKITAADLPEEPVFDIVTSEGTIQVKLYSKTPKHRDNFVKLALDHYYDGVLFHRVINGFMIQTGDPLSKNAAQGQMLGSGGPDYTIPAEFVNEYYHKKGALAAARKGDAANPKKASSGSQFYIVQDEMNCIHLDGAYTVFGETLDGLDVIDKIAAAQTDRYDRPVKDIKIIAINPVL